jgi:hypothetical protein
MANKINPQTGDRLLTIKQVAKLANVPLLIVACHVEEEWARGPHQKLKPYIPIVADFNKRTYRIRESDALQFKASRPNPVIPSKRKRRPRW